MGSASSGSNPSPPDSHSPRLAEFQVALDDEAVQSKLGPATGTARMWEGISNVSAAHLVKTLGASPVALPFPAGGANGLTNRGLRGNSSD